MIWRSIMKVEVSLFCGGKIIKEEAEEEEESSLVVVPESFNADTIGR